MAPQAELEPVMTLDGESTTLLIRGAHPPEPDSTQDNGILPGKENRNRMN